MTPFYPPHSGPSGRHCWPLCSITGTRWFHRFFLRLPWMSQRGSRAYAARALAALGARARGTLPAVRDSVTSIIQEKEWHDVDANPDVLLLIAAAHPHGQIGAGPELLNLVVRFAHGAGR